MDAYTQQNSWILSREFPFAEDPKHHLIECQSTGFCWLRTLDKKKTFPALRLSVNGESRYWLAHNATADIRGSRRRLEHRITKVLSRLIPHDVNGKLMGIDGIIDFWKESPLDQKTAIEDLENIKSSLASIAQLANCLGWFSKEGQDEKRVFTLQDIHRALGEIIPRLCKPSSSFKVPVPTQNKSIVCSPHTLVFWTFSTALVLAAAKESQDTVSLSWQATNGSETPRLQLELDCKNLSPWFDGELPTQSEAVQIFHDWLVALTFVKASVHCEGSTIRVTIPLQDISTPNAGKILYLGHTKNGSLPPTSDPHAEILVGESIEEFAELLATHIFTPTVIFISPEFPKDLDILVHEIVDSITETPLIVR